VLAREEPDHLLLVDEAELDENGAELLGGTLLLAEGLLKLRRGQQPIGDQEVPKPAVDGLTQLLLQEDNGRSKRIPRSFLGAVPPCGRVHSGRSAGFGGPLN